MYDLKNNKFLSKNEVLQAITEEEIFRYFIGHDYQLKQFYLSPLRKESNPSFNIYRNRQGELKYKDFGHSQGSCFDLVARLYDVGYDEALLIIDKEMKLGLVDSSNYNPVRYSSVELIEDTTCLRSVKGGVLQTVVQPFSIFDLKYWNSYGISEELFNRYKVESVKYYIKDREIKWIYHPNNPIYKFTFQSKRFKVYRPYGDKKYGKWRSNTTVEDLQGFEQLPESGEYLIITKALKDVMTVVSHSDIPSIAPQGETCHIPDDLANNLISRFKNIIINFDEDKTGINYGVELAEQFKAKIFYTPEYKDISDFRKAKGEEETIKLIKSII